MVEFNFPKCWKNDSGHMILDMKFQCKCPYTNGGYNTSKRISNFNGKIPPCSSYPFGNGLGAHHFTAARSVHFVDSDEAYTRLQVLFLVSAKSKTENIMGFYQSIGLTLHLFSYDHPTFG